MTSSPSPTAPRIDAHHHVWDLAVREQAWLAELPAIDRTFGLDDLRPSLERVGVDGTVLVQVATVVAETEEFLALAAAEPLVRGVVGWVDLTAPDVADEIARLRGMPGGELLVGVRHQVQGEPDPRWLLRDDVLAGLAAVAGAGLAYDLLVVPEQLPAAVEVVGRVPQLTFVLDHLGKPDIAAGRLDPWRGHLSALAAHPHVAAKLSGMVTEAGTGWTVDTLRPFASHLLEAFGPERVMAGSDWPVCLLAASYTDVAALTEQQLEELSAPERADVLGGTATRVYGLDVPAGTPTSATTATRGAAS